MAGNKCKRGPAETDEQYRNGNSVGASCRGGQCPGAGGAWGVQYNEDLTLVRGLHLGMQLLWCAGKGTGTRSGGVECWKRGNAYRVACYCCCSRHLS